MGKFVNIDVLKKELKKACKGCVYEGTAECLSCYVPDMMALIDVVYERQEHDKRFKKYEEQEHKYIKSESEEIK